VVLRSSLIFEVFANDTKHWANVLISLSKATSYRYHRSFTATIELSFDTSLYSKEMDESVSKLDTLSPSDCHVYRCIALETKLGFYEVVKP
jgi:methylphosphotriester-DNA--protein-cysteine methyltransferase